MDTKRIRELLDILDDTMREIQKLSADQNIPAYEPNTRQPRKPIICGHCNEPGHSARTCEVKAAQDAFNGTGTPGV